MSTAPFTPNVIIVGGGIGGLVLAILLERAQIPYTVLERSAKLDNFGSAIGLSPNLLPLLEQLGLKDEIYKNSKKVVEGFVWDENLKVLTRIDHSGTESR